MKKKLLSLALALALCLGLTVPAFAAELKLVEIPTPVVEEYEGKDYSVGEFQEGLATLHVFEDGYGKPVGFVDKTGKLVISGKFDGGFNFSEGFARVQKDGKWGFIDKTGKEVIPLQYSGAANFSEGFAAVMQNDKIGFIDKTGKEVVPFTYDAAWGFSEGLAAVKKNGKWGFIDQTGKVVIDLQYDNAGVFSQGLAMVEKNGKWGYIDKAGEIVIDFVYDDADDFSEGLARVNQNGKWGFIDRAGEVVVPCQYDGAGSFSQGLAVILQNGKCGYIDKTGKVVIPCKYGYAAPFSGGFAAVYADGQRKMWGFIDKTGKEVVPPTTYTENGEEYFITSAISNTAPSFSDGYALVQRFFVNGLPENVNPRFYLAITVDAEVSGWAREQVDSAAAKGLMPDGLGDDFTVNITRAEFAALAVKLYEAMSGETAPAPGASPFSDTNEAVIIQANALGIVNGKGGGKFAPDDLVTRQEAALMLSRVYTKLGGTIPETAATTFADNGYVSTWARDAVAFMSDKKIVNGVGNNRFDPTGNASIEQAMVIALRMFENLK